MNQTTIGHIPLNPSTQAQSDWTERQYDQLKNQIIAYKYLIRYMTVPSEIIENIRSYSPEEWEISRKKKIEAVQASYKEKFENQCFSLKELGFYFKQRHKDEENIPVLEPDKNLKYEKEYVVESEIENRKSKLEKYLKNLHENDSNSPLVQNIKNELKLLKAYYIQKTIRKDVIYDFISEIDKYTTQNFFDSILHKMLLDRRVYKKQVQMLKKEQKLNDKFEQQLRNGYDIRKKEKQKELITKVINQHTKFMEFHKDKRQKLKKRAILCKSKIENLEIKDKREKDKKEKERIQYLKQNNMDEYKRMLKEAKDSRLEEFMNQTDQFLKEIEDKIKIQKENIALRHSTEDSKDKKNKEGENVEEGGKAEEDPNNQMEVDDPSKPKKELIQIEEEKNEKDEKILEKVYNSKNYYLSAHSHLEEITEQPHMLKFGKLKSYQVLGLQWLVSLYVNSLNGILADEMGLGKTIQTIALLCYIIETKHNEGPFLIIAPLATISNWVIEFNRWAPEIKIVVYKGPPAYRRQLSSQIKQQKHLFNVVLTTYEYIMKDKYSLNKITWQYIIVDEGHRMKNYKSKFTQTLGTQFNSVYRLLLTGTPLQNNLSELWALLNFLLPKIFNSCEDFEKWFNQPFSNKLPGEKNAELTEEQQLLIINRLHTVLRPFLLRREKKDVEKELPSKTEYVIKLDLSAWQKIVYTQIKEQGLLAQDPSTGKMGKKALMNTMMQLRKICNHPYLFIDFNNSLLENINEWIFMASGKFEFLDRIIPKLLCFGHKILIFSQMTHLMDILEYYFRYKGIPCLRLDGNTKADDRGNQIQLFSDEKSEFKVFILSTRAGGLGLNLQAADTVIIFDSDWNPQMDIQAQDRAHRIGQKHKVKVFRLISKKTIEEGILEKAAFKKNMDEKVIRAGLYNVKYSEQERRKKLLDILKNEKEEEEEEDEVPDDAQINEYIARSSEELKAFEQMDRERYEREKKDEKLREIKERMNLDDEAMKAVNYRLIQDYEVPEWVKISKKDDSDKVEEEDICGKGMRIRHKVNYKVDFDDDFDSESEEEEARSLRKKRKKQGNTSDMDNSSEKNYHSSYSYSRKKQKTELSSENGSHGASSNIPSQLDLNEDGIKSLSNSGIGNKVKIKLGDDEDNILKISAEESDNEDMNNNHNQEEDDEMNGTLHNIHNELDA